MKSVALRIICIFAVCTLYLAVWIAPVGSYAPGYEANDYQLTTTPILDGKWTSASEWEGTQLLQLEGGLNATFRPIYELSQDSLSIIQYYLIEFFSDNTNDTGDVWQICYSGSNTPDGPSVEAAGGITPQLDCVRIDFWGHYGLLNAKAYRGNGTVWILITDEDWKSHVQIAESLTSSPSLATLHWITEIRIEHQYFDIKPEIWIRVAAEDISKEMGYQAWPPGSYRDVPDSYGLLKISGTIPEFPNSAALFLLVAFSALLILLLKKEGLLSIIRHVKK